jgi:lysophospholipase L1-like esterase
MSKVLLKKIGWITILGISFWLIFQSYVKIKTRYVINSFYSLPDWKNKCDKFAKNKYQPGIIVFLGNSITEGFDLSVFHNPNILNFGISCDYTEGVLKRIMLIAPLKPTKLFVEIGINDIFEQVPLSEIEDNYEKFILIIQKKSPNTKIYIQSLLPTYNRNSLLTSNSTNVNKVKKLNEFLIKLCSSKKLTFIELFQHFVNDKNELRPELTYDGIHLNSDGYQIWARLLNPYLLE